MKEKPKSFGWPFWLLLLGGIALLYGFAYKSNSRPRNKGAQTEATSNLRQIGLALHEFHKEYGSFPNDETAEFVMKKHPSSTNLSGTSSNALFRQLFAAGIVENEAMFYANFPGVHKPDNDTSPGHLLEKGEVAFAYINGLSLEGNPSRPLAFGPVIPGTTKFDPKLFSGKGILLRIDCSVSSIFINKEGVAMAGSQSLLSPENLLWGGKTPDIRYPEMLSASKPSFFQKLFSK
jgi:hypothetical protein